MDQLWDRVDGFALRLLREDLGITQEVLAVTLGYSKKGSISKIEHADRVLQLSKLRTLLREHGKRMEDFEYKRALAVLHLQDRLVRQDPARAIPEIHESRRIIFETPMSRAPVEATVGAEVASPPQSSLSKPRA